MWTTACTELREHLFLMNVFTVESSDPIETTKKKKRETNQNFLLSSLEVLEISCF